MSNGGYRPARAGNDMRTMAFCAEAAGLVTENRIGAAPHCAVSDAAIAAANTAVRGDFVSRQPLTRRALRPVSLTSATHSSTDANCGRSRCARSEEALPH